MQEQSTVEYRDVPGFPGYRVGSDGSVWSCLRGDWKKRIIQFDGHYCSLVLSGYKPVRVHTLVLLAFVGPRPEGMEACHTDGDCRNNTPSNLRWDTHLSNVKDRKKHGGDPCGERQGSAKLTDELVRAIRSEHANGSMQSVLADKYGVSRSSICMIVSRKRWGHLS